MRFRPLKTVSTTFTAITLILAIPATAILASWNALPNSFLYPVKRGLEKIALALLPQSFFETELRIKLIDRRASEATEVLIQSPNDTQALDALIAEAQAAQLTTVELNLEQRSKSATHLINTLNQTSSKLETTKQTIVQSQPTVIYQTKTIYQNNPSQPAPSPTNQTFNPPPNNITSPSTDLTPADTEQTISSITQTQQQLQDIIQDLEDLEEPVSETHQPQNTPPKQIEDHDSNSKKWQKDQQNDRH